ncbi:MAG: glycosyltransferase [Gammaproteobacteria bacterium]|nr:glycosyltransferase [Gammaproteobacteria bacterium]
MHKIAIFISDLDCGGAQRVMLTLAEGFVAQGFSVDMVLARGGGILENEVPDGVRLVSLSGEKKKKLLFSLKVLVCLVGYLRSVKPEAVLSSITGANLVAVLARGIANLDTVLVLRHENTAPNISSQLRTWLVKKLYPRSDAVITVSAGAGLDLKKIIDLKDEKLHVIENPVNSTKIRKLAQDPVSEPWFNDVDIPVLISVGRLYPQKDFVTLIRAFAKMRETHPARLIILGEGPERDRLELLVRQLGLENDVSMPGIVQNPYPWMRAATVFTLSSLWEGLPIALMEAMALGCRIVATDCHSGPRELLDDGKYGMLVPVSNEDALSEACIAALDAPHNPQLIMTRADNYSPEGIVAKHLQLLRAGD